MTPEVSERRTLAERARDAWQAAQDRVATLRLARARGGDGAPTANDLAKAKADAELAEDRARLAREDAEAYAAAVAAEAEREAIRAERQRVQVIHDRTEELARDFHRAAEEMGRALADLMTHASGLARDEAKLNSRWSEGVWHASMAACAAAVPLNIPFNPARPTPYRDSDRRARFPQELRALLAEQLPAPADPDAAPATLTVKELAQ